MKKYILVAVLLLLLEATFAQTKPKQKAVEKPPTQKEMNAAMEEAMKGMSEEEKAEMRKMMGNVMPALMEQNSKMADYPEFTSNKQLVPKKDLSGINAIPKKKLTQTDIGPYASNLYNKIMTKGDAAEIAIVKKVIAQSPKANDLGSAAILCMMQGHPQAAMALSMKAVQTAPSSDNLQNNMAALLTQYGYPEQAVPVLQKLRNDFPDNSTVMNNLAHAWLGLGAIDSAKSNIRIAGRLNPYHPETKQTEGVIEETTGNPVKAVKDYEESMENSINPFTEQLIKNNKGQSKSYSPDFEKIKKSITIYEYFPRDWIKIPALTDNVSAFESNMKIKNGYTKMFEELEDKIEALTEASNAEVDALMEKGETEFAKEMMKESMKGLSMMSMPAVYVQNVLQAYLQKWAEAYVKEGSAMMKEINAKQKVMTKIGDNDKCPDHDRKNNEFLTYANPKIRAFYANKIEECRVWLNAFCTWAWYIDGNPKNSVMTQCIAWTAFIAEINDAAIDNQFAIAKSCVNQNSFAATYIAPPQIPNFTCPAIVSIPIGSEWQQLSKATNNFDDNKYAIKKATANPVPNHTIAYGADHTSIAEPGPDPFFKSANGSMTPGIAEEGNSPGEQLLDMLNNGPQEAITDAGNDKQAKSPDAKDQEISDYWTNFVKNKIARQKEIDAQDQQASDYWNNYIKDRIARQKALQEARENRSIEWFKEYLKSKIAYSKTEEYKRELEKATAEKIKKLQKNKLAQDLLKKMMSTDCKNVRSTKDIQKELFEKGMMEAGDNMEDLRANGLQPSLNSGLQAPGTFTPVKGLFQ
ncbi:MAG: tetratricopeptide repeat protein [Lutibacter sp.]